MNMPLVFKSAAVLIAAAALSQTALAADGTINFTGTIIASTCTASVNGNDSVQLPKVTTAALNESGKTAGFVPFQINLTNCGAASPAVRANFNSGKDTNPTSGNLKNATDKSAGGGTNVEISILNSTEQKIGLHLLDQKLASAKPDAAGTANFNFFAHYVATGPATAGTVTSTVTYNLMYD